MRKITILLPKVCDAKTGGQKYDLHFISKLKELHENIVFLSDEKFKYKPSIAFYYNIIYLLSIKIFLKTDIFITNSRMYPRLFLFIKILKLCNRKAQFMVIHHHYHFKTKSGLKRSINKFLEINFLKMFEQIIIPSPYVKEVTEKILPKKKIIFLEIGFKKNKTDIKNKSINKNLIYVGTIEKRKGLHLLIEALRNVNQAYRLSLIGKYDEQDDYYLSLVGKIKDYGLEENVIFTGRLSDEELKNKYMDASVFVLPSLHEGYGMVMVEAMQYGLPVIAFNNSAMPYLIVDNYNGLLLEDRSVNELSAGISEVLSDEKKLINLRKNAITTFENVRSNEDLNNDIKNFYKSINEDCNLGNLPTSYWRSFRTYYEIDL